MTTPAFILAAPSSHSGKTSVTLGLLRALSRRSGPALRVKAAKIGPDYIDPAFHQAACGQASQTLDPWAMTRQRLADQLHQLGQAGQLVLIESAMGLFDGAADGSANSAKLAKDFGLPVILVVDCSGAAGSIAALVHGFNSFDPDLSLAGLILNKVASTRHEQILRQALAPLGLPVLACLPRQTDLHLPSRHLGLVQAGDTPELDRKLDALADWVTAAGLPAALLALAATCKQPKPLAVSPPLGLPALGSHIAIARDQAFSFIYPHVLADWRKQGARLSFISPLADEPLPSGVDAIYLPGGYPELHAEGLSAAKSFWASLHHLAAQGGTIYGECGGYMALGRALVDAEGSAWPMAGLLDQTTRFDRPQRHLGYRAMCLAGDCALGGTGASYRGHEFHYSMQDPLPMQDSLAHKVTPLWLCQDAQGQELGSAGQIKGRVFGSYLHLVDSRP